MQRLHLHYRGLITSLKSIAKSPLDHVLNILVISILTFIMCGIIVINKTSINWQNNNVSYPQIMIYMNPNANQADISAIEATLNRYNNKLIKNYQFISKEDGLKSLINDEQLKQIASDTLSNQENPLPDILIINTLSANIEQLKVLVNKINNMPMVDNIQIDEEYANKIDQLINFVKKSGSFIQILFIITIILVIYNMIRLQMLNRKDEIIISRLIGASDSFIMRPLIYYGVLQIVIGSIIAYVVTNYFVESINSIIVSSTSLFGNGFMVVKLSITQLILLVISLIIFTIFSVFLAVQWVFKYGINK